MGDDATIPNTADVSKDPKSAAGIPVQKKTAPPPQDTWLPPGTPEPIIIEDNPPAPVSATLTTPPKSAAPSITDTLPKPPVAAAPIPTPPAPTAPSTPAPQQSQPDAAMEGDIAKILGTVKLPERRSIPKVAQEPKTQYDTTLADPTRDIPHAKPTPSASLPGPGGNDSLVSLHTLKDDLQHVVQENKISYVRAVALEEEKRHRIEERSTIPKVNRRSLFTLFIVILLVGTGLLALAAVFIVMQQRTAESNAALRSNILFAEQSVPFPVDNEAPADVRRTLASARSSSALTLGAILQIVPVTTATDPSGNVSATPISFSAFLTALGTRAPEELSRAVGNEFFFGIHTVDENAPIIIVPVTSYERAFAAMLEWEPYMNLDLEPLFTLMPAQARNENGALVERQFEDVVMRNYDVRALKDDKGVIQLYYSFPTRNVLIIAESPYSFTEILSRLRADRRL